MQASFVDLRKKSAQIIRALQRNERVTVLYRGKPAAVMQPVGGGAESAAATGGPVDIKVEDHPAFGLWADRRDMKNIKAYVRRLRRGRFHAL